MSIRSVLLVLSGVGIGCGAAAVAPVLTSNAASSWACYVVDRFPDLEEAASWEPARNITQGMNQVAAGAAPGTVLSVAPKTHGNGAYASVVCVKN